MPTVSIMFHFVAFCIHLISSILAFNSVTDFSSQIFYETYHWNANVTTNVTRTTTRNYIGSINPVLLVAVNELLTCVAHFVAIVVLNINSLSYTQQEHAMSARRWFSYSVTAGLLGCAVLLLTGETHVFFLVFMIATNVVIQGQGYLIDNNLDNGLDQVKIWPYVFAAILLLVQILYVSTVVFSTSGLTTLLFIPLNALAVIYGLFYTSFALVRLLQAFDEQRSDDAINQKLLVNYDDIYVLLSVTSKILLSWLLIAIHHSALDTLQISHTPNLSYISWTGVQIFVIVFATVSIPFGVYVSHSFPKQIDKRRTYDVV